MERQKIFWVVLSVSVFVVIVLVVGVLLLRQKSSTTAPVTVSPLSGTGTQVYEYQSPPTSPAAQGAQPSGSGTAQTGQKPGDQQTMHFYIGEGDGQNAQPAQTSPTTTTPAVKPVAPAPQASPARTAIRPATSAPAAVKKPQKGIDFWIQTGSYKSQGKAEELVTLLEGKGLTGRVFSYTSKTDTYYRVRIGPYPNKGDAEKFLAEVKQVQGLETSFIAQVTVTRPATN